MPLKSSASPTQEPIYFSFPFAGTAQWCPYPERGWEGVEEEAGMGQRAVLRRKYQWLLVTVWLFKPIYVTRCCWTQINYINWFIQNSFKIIITKFHLHRLISTQNFSRQEEKAWRIKAILALNLTPHCHFWWQRSLKPESVQKVKYKDSEILSCPSPLIQFLKTLLHECKNTQNTQSKLTFYRDAQNCLSCFSNLSKRATNATRKEVENGTMKVPNQQSSMTRESE